MNGFGFRYTRDGMNYHAEYRLAHKSSYQKVRDESGRVKLFSSQSEAEINAARALINSLNGNPKWWRGNSRDSIIAEAERLFSERVIT